VDAGVRENLATRGEREREHFAPFLPLSFYLSLQFVRKCTSDRDEREESASELARDSLSPYTLRCFTRTILAVVEHPSLPLFVHTWLRALDYLSSRGKPKPRPRPPQTPPEEEKCSPVTAGFVSLIWKGQVRRRRRRKRAVSKGKCGAEVMEGRENISRGTFYLFSIYRVEGKKGFFERRLLALREDRRHLEMKS
jgi:hypothetical protein